MEHPGAETGSHEWGLGCCVCRWAGLNTKMARCQVQGLDNITRHQDSKLHKQAVQKWLETTNCAAMGSLAAEASSNPPGAGGSTSVSTRMSAGGETPAPGGSTPVSRMSSGGETPVSRESQLGKNVGHGHVLQMLRIFEEQTSLRSFSRSVEAGRVMKADLNNGNGSRTVARNLLAICAGHEFDVNRKLLLHCAIWGLGQDGKDKALLVVARMVCWSLPQPMRKNLPSGVAALLPSRFGSNGPWVAERALGCGELASDRSGEALAKSTLKVLHTTLPAPGDFGAVGEKGRFFTADNAADETVAHNHLRDELGSLDFDIPDTAHSFMLAIKNGCKGDSEVDLVRGVFLTNKRPMPAISRCLQNSTRFRCQFTDQQRDGIETTMSHLGWSPQRHSSQSRPWGRGSRKICDLMSALAKEVDDKGQFSKACLHNLQTIAPFGRMVLAGMLGDLTAEHSLLVQRVVKWGFFGGHFVSLIETCRKSAATSLACFLLFFAIFLSRSICLFFSCLQLLCNIFFSLFWCGFEDWRSFYVLHFSVFSCDVLGMVCTNSYCLRVQRGQHLAHSCVWLWGVFPWSSRCNISCCMSSLVGCMCSCLPLVRQADVKDPAVEMVHHWLNKFEHRIKVLFIEGQIMTMTNTYTAQILKFFRDPSVVFAAQQAILFVKPVGTDQEAMYEPLERMRVIVGNVLQCLRAAIPETCWRYKFACYALPSPLGPNKPGRDGSKKLMKKNFLAIFKMAKHPDPQRTYEEMLKLLPAAEQHARTGLDNRQAWAAASLEQPGLQWGREGVTLLLGAYITTSNIERFLKRVGIRDTVSSGGSLVDVVICDLHAPRPAEVAEAHQHQRLGGETPRTIIPKGMYLNNIVSAYHSVFKGRPWKKEPKARRDRGIIRDVDKVAQQRKRKGLPSTEGTFIRAREKEIHEVLQEPPEERARKRAKCTHGPVPEDSNKYLTQASVDLRNKAERRKAKKVNKERALNKKNPRRRWKLVRWVGKTAPVVDDSDQNLYAPSLALALVNDSSHSMCEVQTVLSEGGGVTVQSWPTYAKEVVIKGRNPTAAMVVVASIPCDPWQNDWAISCMIIGGFLTTECWLAQAVAKKARPAGLFYPGVLQKGLQIHVCDRTQAAMPCLRDIFLVLHELRKISLVDFGTLRENWKKYLAAHGVRSQPWQKMVAICHDAESKTALSQNLKDTEQSMVVKLSDFLSRHCRVRREVVCSGCWVPCQP